MNILNFKYNATFVEVLINTTEEVLKLEDLATDIALVEIFKEI